MIKKNIYECPKCRTEMYSITCTKCGNRCNEVALISARELDTRVSKVLRAKMFVNIDESVNHDSLGFPIKKPLDKRLSESKFAQLIKDIPTEELLVICAVLGFSSKGLNAIRMYLTAENTRIQRYALKKELEARR